jgi:hypothetical protein
MYAITSPGRWLCALFAVNPNEIGIFAKVALAVALVLTIATGVFTYLQSRHDGGGDMRNRIVGARVMLAGYDPYTFVWQPGMPEEWHDPVRALSRDPRLPRLTTTPPTLWFYASIANLPNAWIRKLAFAVQWAALLGSVCLLVRTLPTQRLRVLFLLGVVFFFILSDFWRADLHLGQLFVIQLLPMSFAVHCCVRRGLDSIPAGLAFGLLALIRPNLLLFVPAFLILGCWRNTAATIGVFVVGVLAPTPFMNSTTWPSYFAMGESFYLAQWNPESLPDAPPMVKIERGTRVDGFVYELTPNTVSTSSSFPVLYEKIRGRAHLPLVDLGLVCKATLALIGAFLLTLLLIRRSSYSGRPALALIVTLTLMTEFFLPHRWHYADMMELVPLALLLPTLLDEKQPAYVALFLVLLGLTVGAMGQVTLPLYLTRVMRSWLVMGTLVALAVRLWLRTKSRIDDPLTPNLEPL